MSFIKIKYHEQVQLEDAVLLEGLPGVGNVGKLAVAHLIDELPATRCAELYSSHFPPQVLIDNSGLVRLVNNEFFYRRGGNGSPDLLLLVGEHQGLDPTGQYELALKTLEVAREMGVTTIYTLGGYGQGQMIPEPRVLGAATSPAMVTRLKEYGVEFVEGEPGSGIMGASGLLLGLGALQGFEGGCLMGETSGYMADPKSARTLLRVLRKLLGIDIDLAELDQRALEVDAIAAQLREMERKASREQPDVNYIG